MQVEYKDHDSPHGERLIWELEPGRQLLEPSQLPKVNEAPPMPAEDFDALLRALQMPRVNLLIADDVGLGKTVEAGLILKELLLRRRIRRVLVLVPAALRLQWRDELETKFALPFETRAEELLGRSLANSSAM